MVWRHGKNTQFRVLRQGAKWTKWRWSVIFCCFLTLSICFFSKRSAKQFRQIGQNCKGKHRERSRNVSFTLFFFPSVSFFETVFCLVNPLPEFSVTVTVRQNDSVRAIRGRTVLWRLTAPPSTRPTQTTLLPTLENTYTQYRFRHFSS